MKRRLFTVLLTLSILTVYLPATAVIAVSFVPGSVPENRPLQPIPEGVAPNISENIESHNLDDSPASVPAGEEQGGREDVHPTPGSPLPLSEHRQAIAVLSILTLAAIGLAVWYYFRTREKEGR